MLLVEEVINLLNEPGNTMNSVAKQVHIGEKRLRKAVNNAGFSYNQHSKAYEFGWSPDVPEAPFDKDITEFLSSNESSNTKSNKKSVTSNKDYESSNIDNDISNITSNINSNTEVIFNITELMALKELASELVEKNSNDMGESLLYQRVQALPRGPKDARKTFALSSKVSNQFDEFARQTKFSKADLLEVALLDLMERYK